MPGSLESRIERQQATIRQLLELPDNAQALNDMLEWFAGVPLADAGDDHMARLPEWAEVTARLGVLSLEEHRSAVSGAFVAALHKEFPDLDTTDEALPVDMDAVQQHVNGAGLKVMQTALSMAPPETNTRIEHPRQIDWLWMAWAVSRKKSILGRLVTLAARQDEVGQAVVSTFEDNATMPEIHAALSALRRGRVPRGALASQDNASKARMRALMVAITRDPLWSQHIWFIEFRNDRYFVVTDTGATPPDCPAEWEGCPVTIRLPSKQDRQDHTNLKDMRSEP